MPRRRRPPVRDPDAPRKATLLELFFDLVYVVALALISRQMVDGLDWLKAAQALVLLAALWWTWTITTLSTDLYDPERIEIKLLVIAVMFGVLMMATAIPEAFGDRGLVFACTYVAIQLGRGLFIIRALRREPQTQRRAKRVFIWFAVSAVPWIIGSQHEDRMRLALWGLALAIDYGGFRLAYPVPGLGVVPTAQRTVTPEHLAERYQQFCIIVLGDAILTIGFQLGAKPYNVTTNASFGVAFATTLLLWRIYVHKAGELLPWAIAASHRPSACLTTAPYTHLVMIAGVVTTVAGFDLVMHEPADRVPPAWVAVILGGPRSSYSAGPHSNTRCSAASRPRAPADY
ncbi:low temperature requirement protein A [Micromonospora zamorensis]|uniref:low temperature requirement protein A n=1 Tax=Micromonospora zamorensis TaxID=709883 RepID=UPI003CFAFCD9